MLCSYEFFTDLSVHTTIHVSDGILYMTDKPTFKSYMLDFIQC